MSAPTSHKRDLRIDVIRGLALWMIFADHIPGNLAAHVTYQHFSLATALEIFIFLAGLSCSLLYGRLLRSEGFVRAEMRALRRVLQIYVGYLCVGAITVGWFFAFRHALDDHAIADNSLALLADHPVRAISAMLWLSYTPQYMDILPFYMALVAATPAILLLFRRSEALAMLVMFGVWLAAALFPQVNVPSLNNPGVVSINPFSWQLLFCAGLWVGERRFLDGRSFRPALWLDAVCLTVALAGAAAAHPTWFDFGAWDAAARTRGMAFESNEPLLPLVDFIACAYLTASYVPADAPWLQSKWLAPLRVCGRNSLEVFCVGVGASMLGDAAFRLYGPKLALQFVVNAAGLAAITGIALLVDRDRAAAAELDGAFRGKLRIFGERTPFLSRFAGH